MKTSEGSLHNLWISNIRIIWSTTGEEREKRAESLFKEIIAENFPNLES